MYIKWSEYSDNEFYKKWINLAGGRSNYAQGLPLAAVLWKFIKGDAGEWQQRLNEIMQGCLAASTIYNEKTARYWNMHCSIKK